MKERKIMFFTMLVCTVIMGTVFAVADPTGASVTEGTSSTRAGQTAQQVTAEAGNVTGLNINQTKVTDIWQGYYGNISGEITLDNAANQTFYDWNYATTTGEVYAVNTSISSWSGPTCANQALINTWETGLGITSTWADSINETFKGTSHPSFSVGSTAFTTCRSTQAYGSGATTEYWNVLVNVGNNLVFASVVNSTSTGFNGNGADFELLVPTDQATNTEVYYFYAELN
ncbi:MAG: hypothetical protein V1859_04485 [archaeon]